MAIFPENYDPFESYEESSPDSKQQAVLKDIAREQPPVSRALAGLINDYPHDDKYKHRRNLYLSGVAIAYKYLKAVDRLPDHVRSTAEIAQFLGERNGFIRNIETHRRSIDPDHETNLLSTVITAYLFQTRELNQNLAEIMRIYSQSKPLVDRAHLLLGVYDIAGLLLYNPPQPASHS